MKTNKIFIAFLAVLLVMFTLLPSAVFAAGFPKHQNYIADEAGILTEELIREIRDTNKNLQGDVGYTIAVCTVNTLGGTDIADYARDLFENWKLGEGILVLIAKEDKNYFFVPSIGLEEILTNEEIAASANLKLTSLYDLAIACGIEDAEGFVQHFIDYEREVARHEG